MKKQDNLFQKIE
jgi:hypothetical protein